MLDICGLIWVTGLSGAGKTTFAKMLQEYLQTENIVKPILLDGDDLRDVFDKETAHSPEERVVLANMYSKLASLLVKQGHCVICSTISMFQSVRNNNRFLNRNYCEIFIDVDDNIRIKRRDVGSLTKKDVSEENSIFQLPSSPDIMLYNPTMEDFEEACNQIRLIINSKWKNN